MTGCQECFTAAGENVGDKIFSAEQSRGEERDEAMLRGGREGGREGGWWETQ